MKLGIFGKGRLGTAIATEVSRAASAAMAMGVPAPFELAWEEDIDPCAREGAEVAIDSSVASAVRGHVEWAVACGTDLVISVTGWEMADIADLVRGRIGVLVAPNLSPGAALVRRMAKLMGAYASAVSESDIAICEWHHRLKADAPSGTAKSFADAVISGGGRYSGWSMGAYEKSRINVTSIRSGYDAGRHEIILDSPLETITVTHQARDRAVFASGALKAAAWLRGRKGVFTMDDFAAAMLDASLADRR